MGSERDRTPLNAYRSIVIGQVIADGRAKKLLERLLAASDRKRAVESRGELRVGILSSDVKCNLQRDLNGEVSLFFPPDSK